MHQKKHERGGRMLYLHKESVWNRLRYKSICRFTHLHLPLLIPRRARILVPSRHNIINRSLQRPQLLLPHLGHLRLTLRTPSAARGFSDRGETLTGLGVDALATTQGLCSGQRAVVLAGVLDVVAAAFLAPDDVEPGSEGGCVEVAHCVGWGPGFV
jgi:hypothetical protein